MLECTRLAVISDPLFLADLCLLPAYKAISSRRVNTSKSKEARHNIRRRSSVSVYLLSISDDTRVDGSFSPRSDGKPRDVAEQLDRLRVFFPSHGPTFLGTTGQVAHLARTLRVAWHDFPYMRTCILGRLFIRNIQVFSGRG